MTILLLFVNLFLSNFIKHRRNLMKLIKDLTGMVFGRLTVVSFHHRDENGANFWLCKCSCGNEKVIRQSSLVSCYNTKSCGCLRKETALKFSKTSISMHEKRKSESYKKGKLLQSKSSFYYI